MRKVVLDVNNSEHVDTAEKCLDEAIGVVERRLKTAPNEQKEGLTQLLETMEGEFRSFSRLYGEDKQTLMNKIINEYSPMVREYNKEIGAIPPNTKIQGN